MGGGGACVKRAPILDRTTNSWYPLLTGNFEEWTMKLEGIHHITAITADAQGNVDFYAGVLGLRLVKKSVNQDQTSVYHLFYADETGDAGSDITFFEYPGLPVGRARAGMIHRIVWRVTGPAALDFWEQGGPGRGE